MNTFLRTQVRMLDTLLGCYNVRYQKNIHCSQFLTDH